MPSALAVLRLMTSSNVVGCWTGRLLALEDPSSVNAGLAIHGGEDGEARPVADQAACCSLLAGLIYH
jgi:hypothetical protein